MPNMGLEPKPEASLGSRMGMHCAVRSHTSPTPLPIIAFEQAAARPPPPPQKNTIKEPARGEDLCVRVQSMHADVAIKRIAGRWRQPGIAVLLISVPRGIRRPQIENVDQLGTSTKVGPARCMPPNATRVRARLRSFERAWRPCRSPRLRHRPTRRRTHPGRRPLGHLRFLAPLPPRSASSACLSSLAS